MATWTNKTKDNTTFTTETKSTGHLQWNQVNIEWAQDNYEWIEAWLNKQKDNTTFTNETKH